MEEHTFDLANGIEILGRTPVVVRAWLADLPDDWVRRNEGTDTWSPFDIIGHLIHGEKTDWIPRAKQILDGLGQTPFPPFDRFAQHRDSMGKTMDDLLREFDTLRAGSLEALQGFQLTAEDLELQGTHPAFGTVTLGQLLATWVTHDLNHLSQIARVMANQVREAVGPWEEYLSILRP